MCGIYASIGAKYTPSRLDIESHRGPDGEGMSKISTPSGNLIMAHAIVYHAREPLDRLKICNFFNQ